MKSGYVSIVGRPNVGKSTLLNRLLGQKISITSRKPQTTRHNILGIKTTENVQMIIVDTPGMHINAKGEMNQYLNRAANQTLHDVDVILFMVEGTRWTDEDKAVLSKLEHTKIPVILVVNKSDRIEDKAKLFDHMNKLSALMTFAEIIPISAKKGKHIDKLEQLMEERIPDGDLIYPEDQVTDRSVRFLVSEMIREKLMRTLGQELPYALTVEIEKYEEDESGLVDIAAVIWVERKGQKAIIIGKKGQNLKNIGQQARIDMEKMLEQKVFLQLWVKVKEGWSDDIRALRSLGYGE